MSTKDGGTKSFPDVDWSPAGSIGLAVAWVTVVAWVFVAAVSPLFGSDTVSRIGYSWMFSLVVTAPFLVVWRHGLALFTAPRRQVVAALAGLLAVCTYLGLLADLGWEPLVERLASQLAVGTAEEFAFRGYVWDKTRQVNPATGFVIGVNVICFVVAHLPVWILNDAGADEWIAVSLLGIVLCGFRAWSGNLFVPAAVHILRNVV